MDTINDVKKINSLELCLIESLKSLKLELAKKREKRSSDAVRIELIKLNFIQYEFKKALNIIAEYVFVNDFSNK